MNQAVITILSKWFFVERTNKLICKNRAHWHPDILALSGMVEELGSLTLLIIGPITRFAIVNPGTLDILS